MTDLYTASLAQEEEAEIELTLEQYEEGKKYLNQIKEVGDAARRLPKNEDFNALVMEGYFTNEAHRLADLITSGKLNEKTLKDCQRQLVSIGDFRLYLKNMLDQADMADQELEMLEEARDEAIKAEEANAG